MTGFPFSTSKISSCSKLRGMSGLLAGLRMKVLERGSLP